MTAAFEALPLPKTPFSLAEGLYKIYKTRTEFIPVKAHSALEAIKNSGCENIYRVERDSLDKNYLLSAAKGSEMLLAKDQPAAAAPATPAAATEAAPADAAAAPAAEAPKA
jgi:hypothetical protein